MGAVAFLQNKNRVPHVAVHEVNPEVGTNLCLDLTPIKWARQRPRRIWEVEAVSLGLYRGGGVLPLIPVADSVLQLAVAHKLSRHQFRCPLWAV